MFCRYTIYAVTLVLGAFVVGTTHDASAQAVSLPSTIDAGRIDRRTETQAPTAAPKLVLPKIKGPQAEVAPEGSKAIQFQLRQVKFEGMTAYTPAQVADIYEPYVGQKVTLDTVWLIAGKLTERYQAAGYFLSRAYVPAQEIEGGNITIRVVEGYISDIDFKSDLTDHSIVESLLNDIRAERPITSRTLESSLLRLNDLPGVSVRAVLALPKDKSAPEGATVLDMVPTPKEARGRISFDNNGSRFLGPYEASAQYQAEIIPLQKTSFTVLGSTPLNELKYGSLRHEIPVMPNGTVEAYASYTKAKPGYTLKVQEIDSESMNAGLAFNYQWLRQRDENFKTSLAFDARETRSTILSTPLTQDATRALRASGTYDMVDSLQGFTQFVTTLSQGIDGLGSSKAGDLNLSRANAKPDFQKAEFMVSRLQALGSDFNAYAAVSGQLASGTLYSSEQFGYGGQAFGRAYDASEITGDEGVAGAIELRYTGFGKVGNLFSPVPYVFYDIGKVWNYDPTQADVSGSSTGFGFRTNTDVGISTNLGLAFPLTRKVETPQTWNNGMNPRFIFELSYGF